MPTKEADEFYKNPMFYAMGHFSKFVKEGATKLGLASENQKKLDATAFRNPDGSTAVVILNRWPVVLHACLDRTKGVHMVSGEGISAGKFQAFAVVEYVKFFLSRLSRLYCLFVCFTSNLCVTSEISQALPKDTSLLI